MNIEPLVIAIPKGRISEELVPILAKVGIRPEKAFFDESERQLQFACENSDISLIRVRSFDIATFIAFGAAHIGVCGLDVLMEFNYSDLYAPLNLNIGHCRLSLAEPDGLAETQDLSRISHLRGERALPDEAIEDFLLVIEACHFYSKVCRADTFVRFLSIFTFHSVGARFVIFFSKIFFNYISNLRERDLTKVRAVSTHVSNKTNRSL